MNFSKTAASQVLTAVALLCLLLLFHNHAFPILPGYERPIEPGAMQRVLPAATHVASVTLAGLPDNNPINQRSRVRLREDGTDLVGRVYRLGPVLDYGHGRWAHTDGRLTFTATDGSNPRTNGKVYTYTHPFCYGPGWNRLALLGFAAALFGLHRLSRQSVSPPAPATASRKGWMTGLGLLVFVAGLYCNTGTLAPYAITSIPVPDKTTGLLQHVDQPDQRALYDFVQGADRSAWEGSLFLRRILFPILIWPFAHGLGFEVGGVVAQICWNVAVFAAWLVWVRRRWGGAAADAALWLGALYPGAAYWVGLPQVHGLIYPVVLVLMAALHELEQSKENRHLFAASLVIGLGYLVYDFFAFFAPATFFLLARRGLWGKALACTALQLTPLLLWILALPLLFHLPLANSNTSIYSHVALSYLHPGDLQTWGRLLAQTPEVLGDVFLGSNFLFLPTLFLILVVINARSPRPLLTPAEQALLGVAAALFLFNNLAPEYGGKWQMRGAWIARIYQPLFVVLLGAVARWWAHHAGTGWRRTGLALLGATCLANALIVFGPVLKDPLQVSGEAYYRFYNHSENHWMYRHCLERFGRHPLGFTRPLPAKADP